MLAAGPMLEFISGDVLKTKERYLAQGVAEGNQEGLGTGLALKISRLWPDVQKAFKKHARSGRFRGGEIWCAPPTNDRPGVLYLATQPDMYKACLPYLRKALKKLRAWAEEHSIVSVAMPKIGAGLGKLSWAKQVKPLLVEILDSSTCRFVVSEDFREGDLDA